MDSNGIDRSDRAEPCQVDADIAFPCRCRYYGDSRWAGRAAHRCLHVVTSARAPDEAKDDHKHCGAQGPEDSTRIGLHAVFLRGADRRGCARLFMAVLRSLTAWRLCI